jgi:DNA-binding winged helix-turn-helix (wHTH) protein
LKKNRFLIPFPGMRLRFGDYEFDRDARELRRAGGPVALSPKAFQLLLLLLERRPDAIPQRDLRDTLWPDAHVGYTSLARLVAEVRRSLGESARAPGFVRTVPRFGYAFAGDAAEAPGFEPAPMAGVFVAKGREYVFPRGETLVGRGEQCGVRLPSTEVSRVHARVLADEEGVSIADAGSKNGTWVNGQRRGTRTVLRDGDEVVFGTFRVVFRHAGTGGSTRTGRPGTSAGSRADRSPVR